jgi:hypothetical protein
MKTSAPHPDLLSPRLKEKLAPPSEVDLIDAERFLDAVEATPARFIFRGADEDWWVGGWEAGAKARVPEIMRRLIEFARENRR